MTDWIGPVSAVLALPVASLAGYPLWLHIKALTAAERFALSFVPPIAFLASLQLATFAFHLPARVPQLGVSLLVVAALRAVRTLEVREDLLRIPKGMVLALVLAAGQLTTSLLLRRVFIGGGWFGDWWMHFDIARVFVHQQVPETVWPMSSTLVSRNPLLNILGAFAFSLFGTSFGCFAVVSALCNGLAVLGIFLFAQDLAGGRADRASFAAIFAAANFWVLNCAGYTWPKMLALYFIFLAYHFYARAAAANGSSDQVALLAPSVGCIGLGFLTHQVAAVYLAPVLVHGFLSRGLPSPKVTSKALVRGSWAFVPVIGWYAWVTSHFGLSTILLDSPTAKMMGGSGGFWRGLAAGLEFLANSVVGLPAFVALVHDHGAQGLVRFTLWFHMNLLPGLVTLPIVCALPWALRARPQGTIDMPQRPSLGLLSFLFGGLFLSLLLHPLAAETGGAHSVFFPTSVGLALLAWLRCFELPQKLRVLVVTLAGLESFAVFWIQLAAAEVSGAGSGNLQLKLSKGIRFPADDVGLVVKVISVILLVAFQIWALRSIRRTASD